MVGEDENLREANTRLLSVSLMDFLTEIANKINMCFSTRLKFMLSFENFIQILMI